MNYIDRSATYIAQSIRKHNKNAGSEIALKYALTLLINTSSAIIVSLIICTLTDRFIYAMLSIVGFLVLRYFSGGLHLSSSFSCCLFSTCLITLVAHSSFLYFNLGFIINCIAFIILCKTAPNGIKGVSRIKPKYYPLLKLIALCIVSSNFYFQSSVLATVFFSQSVLTTSLAYSIKDYIERWGQSN
ncbi:Accessory gene regulator protein B [Paenibacillus solanacearum]|uniref:Accessory gene regulator protein B n=1 Tax=Paenibacillus solanacearum TaxID=2048548 RepID=A0A916NJE2_9BACL|nr:accessory gene regulator B family protein [Paenibacillus solanacearum]CAG7625762.1 Accessory gene regulator protein B [Paenibacillus solanacearum]